MKKHILIIEDETDIIELIKYNLEKEGFEVSFSKDGEAGIRQVKNISPDLVVLDIMLPGIDGLEVAKRMKKEENLAHIPIIMLTAKTKETDVVVGLEMGADDYVTKPFSPKILTSRIKAVLRRHEVPQEIKKIKVGDITIDASKHKVNVLGRDVLLTPTEFKLLVFMAQRPGIVLSRDKLLDYVFGYESAIYDRTVDAHIKSLRKKLGESRDYIETVHGIGYRFREI